MAVSAKDYYDAPHVYTTDRGRSHHHYQARQSSPSARPTRPGVPTSVLWLALYAISPAASKASELSNPQLTPMLHAPPSVVMGAPPGPVASVPSATCHRRNRRASI
jgi:hypothetical protein